MNDVNKQQYWEDRLSNNWGPHGGGMLLFGENYNKWMYRLRAINFKRIIKRQNVDLSTSSVLDVGCGTGFYIDQWLKLGTNNLTGIDIAPIAISHLRHKFPQVHLEQLDIGKGISPLREGSMDIISAMDVLFHITDDHDYQQAFNNMHTLLRENGILIFTENFLHGSTKRYQDYWTSRSLPMIKKAVKEAGFMILARRPLFFLMASPVDTKFAVIQKVWYWFTRLLPGRERLGWLVGAILFPLELLLTLVLSEGPTTEIMVCKKIIKSLGEKETEKHIEYIKRLLASDFTRMET